MSDIINKSPKAAALVTNWSQFHKFTETIKIIIYLIEKNQLLSCVHFHWTKPSKNNKYENKMCILFEGSGSV